MKFQSPLRSATLVRRYKRFLADIEFDDGHCTTAHVANPGSMLGLNQSGLKIWVEANKDPKRKLKHSWKLAEIDPNALVCVDTHTANKVVAEALSAARIFELVDYTDVRSEVRYGENSRVDFLLSAAGLPNCYLEVKSVTLCRENGLAEFPDSKTDRGRKHLVELAKMVGRGHRAVLLFLVQRNDCNTFAAAGDIDPAYATELSRAVSLGVEVLCYGTEISYEGLQIGGALDFTPTANPNRSPAIGIL